MRILSISVTGLFGRFNHTIELSQKERISVVHGPNGYGKSAILALVHAMFSRKPDVLRATRFDQLRIGLEDNIVMELTRESTEVTSLSGQRNIRLFYTLYVPGHDRVIFEAKPDFFGLERWYDPRQTQPGSGAVRETPTPWPPGAGPALGADPRDHEGGVPRAGAVPHVHHHIGDARQSHHGPQAARTSSAAALGEHQRSRTRERRTAHVCRRRGLVCEEIRTALRDAQLQYSRMALSQESSFPARAMEALKSDDAPSDEQLAESLQNLESRRQQLAALGLLPIHAESEKPDVSGGDANTRKLLALHAQDADEKLRVFDTLADKVIVLENIVDKRFPFKHLRIDAEQGFVFESDDGEEVAPTLLSAGERHQLLLLYQCLFKQSAGSLLLIDDPELSLHSSWHAEFLKDMEEVVAVADIDVLMATHSQAMIEACGDRATELKAPA